MPCYRPDGAVAGEHVWGPWVPDRHTDRYELRYCERCPAFTSREVVRDG